MNTEIVAFINNVGFPITISIYLLYRMERKLDLMIACIQELTTTLKTQ